MKFAHLAPKMCSVKLHVGFLGYPPHDVNNAQEKRLPPPLGTSQLIGVADQPMWRLPGPNTYSAEGTTQIVGGGSQKQGHQ